NYVFLSDTADPNLKVGIGTQTPGFRLTLEGDGGMLARGTFGSGVQLSSITTYEGLGTRFLWYPRKGAVRGGTVDTYIGSPGDQWNDANIGNYSVAFGRNTLAKGEASVAFGFRNEARDNHSAA